MENTKNAQKQITEADVWPIGSPTYNTFFSSALKNLFEYINHKKTSGKVAGNMIFAAGNIGFINVQKLITQLPSYFRVITNPNAVFLTTEIISENNISDVVVQNRLKEMINESANCL